MVGDWFVTLSDLALARYGEMPTRSQVESIRQSLHRLEESGWVELGIVAGQLAVEAVNTVADLNMRNARAIGVTYPELQRRR